MNRRYYRGVERRLQIKPSQERRSASQRLWWANRAIGDQPRAAVLAARGCGAVDWGRASSASGVGVCREARSERVPGRGSGGGGQSGAAGVGSAVIDQPMGVWVRQGVGSARAIEEMCEWEPAYQWLTGAVVVNAHTLSDFRVKHEAALKELFVQVLGLLSSDGLIGLERVMQDGTKIRAHGSG